VPSLGLGPASTTHGLDVSADGLSLYLGSASGLLVARRASLTDRFSQPVPVGPTPMTSPEVWYPSVSPDELEVYYQSQDAAVGVWRATRATPAEPFGAPALLINDSLDADLAGDGRTLFTRIAETLSYRVRDCVE
jgi:hypothetical protein